VNYDAQDAVQEFLNRDMEFRIFTEVYYRPRHAAAVEAGRTTSRSGFCSTTAKSTQRSPTARTSTFFETQRPHKKASEHIELKCNADKIDSSPLTVEVETPDGQHAETTYDLSKIK
jgi:hypothetical protein